MTDAAHGGYGTAREHLIDELALVGLFIARALSRGRAEGWLDANVPSFEITDERLFEQFRMIEARIAAAERPLPMDLLRRRLELTITEQRVLWTLLAYELDPRLRRLLDHLSSDSSTGVSIGTLLALLYEEAEGSCYVELAPGGHLDSLHLIEIEPSATASSRRRVRIPDRVIELAAGIVRLDREIERFARLDELPLMRSLIMESALDNAVTGLVRAAIEQPCAPMLVLVGPEGSGKRTLARNAVARAGMSLLSVDCEVIPTAPTELDRVMRAIFRDARLFGAAVLLENLDRLLEENRSTRMRILDHAGLTTTPHPVIAMMSREYPLRIARGIHTITIPPLRESDRLKLWRQALGSNDTTEFSAELASRYHVTGGVIVASAARAIQQAQAEQRPVNSDDIHHAIRGHVDALLGGLGTRVITTQRWEDVVLPDDTLSEVREMVARVKHRRKVFDEWGFAKKLQRGLGLSALFHGPPGTGKTMVAGLIARELGLDLYQVDLSRVVSKWVGETEKQLASLFAAAESGHAVLLFDEADSLFSKRTDVKSSNDRYANLEVNYLLQRMESFAGIMILTTNHDSAIDEAFRRRLSFRIEFPKPEPEERERIWRAIVPREVQLAADVDFAELADRYEMTGGYIRNAALRAAFFAASEGTAIRRAHLQRAAMLEMASMGKVIGGRVH
jgi:SpoVK/Ycf46/Vps4 family AAA+-type ATPase